MGFMDQIDEITTDLVQVKNEQCIILRTRSNESKHESKLVLTNNDEIGLKEWSSSLRRPIFLLPLLVPIEERSRVAGSSSRIMRCSKAIGSVANGYNSRNASLMVADHYCPNLQQPHHHHELVFST